MARVTRRDLLKVSAAATAAAMAPVDSGRAAHARLGPQVSPHLERDELRERLLLDFGWRFHLGDADNLSKDFGFGTDQRTFAKSGSNTTSVATPDFDDSAWTKINIPHDWAVELPFTRSETSLANKDEDPRAAHGFKPLGREYPQTSIGWYRRTFDLPITDLGRRLSLEFDGVFRDCLVILNGHIVGRNESGYCPFRADVTDFVNYGGKNVLVVRVDATLGEGWFYEGAGIYRHVWLVKTHPVHVPQWGMCVRSEVSGNGAMVWMAVDVVNGGDTPASCQVVFAPIDPHGTQLGQFNTTTEKLGVGETRRFEQSIAIDAPALWSIDAPQLYRLVGDVRVEGTAVDRMSTAFGIRTIHFDPQLGFFLNGLPLKLKGTCNHQDHAGIGSALPDRLHSFRIEQLKEMGSNAYRSSHNPPAPELLDACDRLGMLVIDETRMMSSDDEGLSQLSRMIRRDRNHPCVILWSIGNEEQAQQGTALGGRVARTMKRLANKLDPTRPITAAMDGAWGEGISPVLDVIGFNYRIEKIDDFHKRLPSQPIIGSETGSTVATRGIYVRDNLRGYLPAYDTEFPWWASTAESWWKIVAERAYIAGGFVWTGFDYRGEPTPFNRWPNVSSQFGIMDSCGFAKDNWFYYRARWSDAPLLHLFPHWSWAGKEGQPIEVWCHTNLDTVELFLNGASLGNRSMAPNDHVAWTVPFVPGRLEARGYSGGVPVLTSTRETTGVPAAIMLRPDRAVIGANSEDISLITVEIVDAAGRRVPTADNEVTFRMTGPGELIGVGNGDPASHEPDKASKRRAFNGLCLAIVQAGRRPGNIRITAAATGLTPAVATLRAQVAHRRPFVA